MIVDMNFRGMRWQLPEVAQGGEYATTAHNMYRINSALEPLLAGAKSTTLPTSDFLIANTLYLHDDQLVGFDFETDVASTQITGDLARRLYFIDPNGLLTVLRAEQIPTNYPTPITGREIVGLGGPTPNILPGTPTPPDGAGMTVLYISGPNPQTVEADRDNAAETIFVYTNLNKYGEESAPSPPSQSYLYVPGETEIQLGGAFSSAPDPQVVGHRVYMLVDGIFRRIAQFDESIAATPTTALIPNLTTVKASQGTDFIRFKVDHALTSEELVSAEWDPPPNSLVTMASLDNGVLAIATEHDIYLSEPYYWHAFPQTNSYTVTGTIKRIANIGGGFAVMTDRGTQFFFGSSPDSMIQSSVTFPYSIVDRSSFTAFEGGGIYTCDDGIAMISAAGGQIMTDGWVDRESMRDNVKLSDCRTGMYEGRVLVATRNPENDNPIGYCFNLQIGEITSFDINENVLKSGFLRDPRSNEVCYVTDNVGLSVFNRGNQLVALWESGDIWLPRAISLNSVYVESDEYPVTVKVTPDGLSTKTIEVDKPRARRMPVTGRAKNIRVRIESGQQVGRCALATDMRGF